jgi:hypothetical protein
MIIFLVVPFEVRSPQAPTQDPTFDGPLLFLEPVPLGTQPIDAVEHPFQQRFGRRRRNPCPLKLPDFPALSLNLGAHPFDLFPNLIKLHDGLARPVPFRSAGEQ